MSATINASNLPKFTALERERYLKILLSESEMAVFELKMKKINSHLKENGAVLNVPEFFRIFITNLDDRDLLNVMTKLYLNDVSPIFHYTKDSSQ